MTKITHQEEYELIMRSRNAYLHQGDKRSRKLRMGAIPHSPELDIAQARIELWKAVRTKHVGQNTAIIKLCRLERKKGQHLQHSSSYF